MASENYNLSIIKDTEAKLGEKCNESNDIITTRGYLSWTLRSFINYWESHYDKGS